MSQRQQQMRNEQIRLQKKVSDTIQQIAQKNEDV